jgi:leucine dehydrogenase
MQVHTCEDAEVGLRAVIAIDDTTLGPALGGVRWKAYASEADAVTEASRLAAGMTLKNAAAELPYGGGKSVILDTGRPVDRAAVLHAFGAFVAQLDGSYIPGVDMGTTTDDLAEIGTVAPDVACSSEDPSPWTALGTWASIRSAVRHADGATTLDGVTVAVQGAGHVGANLARLLADDGARVLVADVDASRARQIADEVGGDAVDARAVLTVPCDVLAPCAVARVIGSSNVDALRCRIVAGAANDLLDDPRAAGLLARRDIVYVPDFLANAGGVIHIHALRSGWDEEQLHEAVLRIGDRVDRALATATASGLTPLSAAEGLARERLSGRDLSHA